MPRLSLDRQWRRPCIILSKQKLLKVIFMSQEGGAERQDQLNSTEAEYYGG